MTKQEIKGKAFEIAEAHFKSIDPDMAWDSAPFMALVEAISEGMELVESTKPKSKVRAWKILHKPTGLYYVPGCPNLSKRGKTYSQKPSLKIMHGIRVSDTIMHLLPMGVVCTKNRYGEQYLSTHPEDFEIVEIS